MKATLEIPDDLYRRVKARSAMEGRPLRSVAVKLFQDWLKDEPSPAAPPPAGVADNRRSTRFHNAPWLAIVRRYVRPGMSHDMDEIRAAAARGWSAEIAKRLKSPSSKS